MWFSQGLSIELIFNLLIFLLGIASFSLGGYFTYQSYFRQPSSTFIPANAEWQSYLGELVNRAQLSGEESSASASFVDISGAVEKPGVYQISNKGRVQDVVLMAGGFLPQANKQFIHQKLNLSRKISDQEKIYIPLEGEGFSPSVEVLNEKSVDKRISLGNTTTEELMLLEGIGEKRAESILAGIPYQSEEDFLERSGLSRNLAQELLESYISL